MQNYRHITREDKIIDIVNHEAFKGFGRYIFPLDNRNISNSMKLKDVDLLLPYHNNINLSEIENAINHMIDKVSAGNKIFYDIYTEKEKNQDPTKIDTGIFFFKGKVGAPFAIICPGGGFSYIGAIHEGFPLAIELSKKGYNAFVIKYRVGYFQNSEFEACRDLSRAISYIYENAKVFEVDRKNYSLWGGSAGARMAADIGTYGVEIFGESKLPKPCTVIMQYTGHQDYCIYDPPTFAVVGTNDTIANPLAMKRRIQNLKNCGIDAKINIYRNLRHGFGLGTGTNAEGWVDDAVDFWNLHMEN